MADNGSNPLDRPTIVEALDGAGYRTMLAGKYLNSVGCERRPEFDEWDCYGTTGTGYSLKDPIINVNGTNTRFTGYTTDILAGKVQGLRGARPRWTSRSSPCTPRRRPHTPADDDRYASLPVAPAPAAVLRRGRRGPSGKPSYLDRTPISAAKKASIDRDHRVMTRAVPALDDSVETILDGLGPRAENTFVVYFSDNGWLYGEHRWRYKVVPYEESVRVPFAIRYPPLTSSRRGTPSRALVQNIDIAPTIADLAGIPWSRRREDRSCRCSMDRRRRSGTPRSSRPATERPRRAGPRPARPGSRSRSCRSTGGSSPAATSTWSTSTGFAGALRPDGRSVRAPQPAHRRPRTRPSGRSCRDLAALMADPHRRPRSPSRPAPAGNDRLAQFRYFTQSSTATYRCRIDPCPRHLDAVQRPVAPGHPRPGHLHLLGGGDRRSGTRRPDPCDHHVHDRNGRPGRQADGEAAASSAEPGTRRSRSRPSHRGRPSSAGLGCSAGHAPPFAPCTSPKPLLGPSATGRGASKSAAVDPAGHTDHLAGRLAVDGRHGRPDVPPLAGPGQADHVHHGTIRGEPS